MTKGKHDKDKDENKGKNKNVARIRYIGFDSKDKQPELAVYAIDRKRQALKVSVVNSKGEFSLPDGAIEKADTIVVGPKTEDISTLDRKLLVSYRPNQFKAILDNTGRVEIPKLKWYPWLTLRKCVSGSVSHCHWHPGWLRDLFSVANLNTRFFPTEKSSLATDFARGSAVSTISDRDFALPFISPFSRKHCNDVCDGVVEVYRRSCCCNPWIIFDPRFDALLEELERLRDVFPPDPWPPRLQPAPVPFEGLPFFKGATLNEAKLFAGRDLTALRSLPAERIPAYINARPYLHCHCGTSSKVADGFIQPDGTFSICWNEPRRFTLLNCHDEYAYVVKQAIDGETITIYNGVAANKWFHVGDNAELVSYHSRAISCRHNEFPGEGAFALLQDIGGAGSFRLKTPNATGWDRVAHPANYNDGLADPAVNAAAAKGELLDRNWGGTLPLRYHFSEEMKGIGAKYYRVSVVAADNHGNPTGDRTYLAPNQWRYYEYHNGPGGIEIHNHKASLGPENKNGQFNLYEIPYDEDERWHSGQYHAMLNTTAFTEGRYLVTLEVFTENGKVLRPTGTPNPDPENLGDSTESAFVFQRWEEETGPMENVPFASLTHMFWWDNRKAVAKIEDLRVGGTKSNEECQFLVGSGASQFSVGYRAYHEEPMFMLDHRLWWRRGLGGPSGVLTNPHPNLNNVGVPGGTPDIEQSGENSFATMLAGLEEPKCSFSLNLHTNVKTFNGSGTLNSRDAWDQAAFALEMTS